jgi:hypothetical protein
VDSGLRASRRRGQFTQIGLFGAAIQVDFELICYRELRVTGPSARAMQAGRRPSH